MKKLFLLLIPFVCLADDPPVTGSLLGSSVERVYTSPVTNRAWRRDFVMVKNGALDDPTGTLASKADIDFLSAVEDGISQVYVGGSNGFARAEANFRKVLAEHPPSNATHIAMVLPPYSTLRPSDRNPYAFLTSETNSVGTTNVTHWFFSHPFTLKPRMTVQDIYLDANGNVKTNYSEASFVDYHNDATNNFALVDGDWDRIIRLLEPPNPVTGSVIVRKHHLRFGHPENGFNPGALNIDVRPDPTKTNALHTVTGTYTDTVNRVYYEFTRGACTKFGGY